MKILLTILLLSAFQFMHSQDVIIKKNGDEIKSKVLEVLETTIKYKAADNLEGPIYTLQKSEIFKINYANGKSDFFAIEKNNTQPNISRYDSLTALSKKNKVVGILGLVSGPVFMASGAALATVGALDNSPGSTITGPVYIACGAILGACGVAELVLGGVSLVKSKKLHDAALQEKQQASMHFTGTGLVFQF